MVVYTAPLPGPQVCHLQRCPNATTNKTGTTLVRSATVPARREVPLERCEIMPVVSPGQPAGLCWTPNRPGRPSVNRQRFSAQLAYRWINDRPDFSGQGRNASLSFPNCNQQWRNYDGCGSKRVNLAFSIPSCVPLRMPLRGWAPRIHCRYPCQMRRQSPAVSWPPMCVASAGGSSNYPFLKGGHLRSGTWATKPNTFGELGSGGSRWVGPVMVATNVVFAGRGSNHSSILRRMASCGHGLFRGARGSWGMNVLKPLVPNVRNSPRAGPQRGRLRPA